jgi:hypothetical protein
MDPEALRYTENVQNLHPNRQPMFYMEPMRQRPLLVGLALAEFFVSAVGLIIVLWPPAMLQWLWCPILFFSVGLIIILWVPAINFTARRLPMLTFCEGFLQYRRLRIPWCAVAGVKELTIVTGPGIGLILKEEFHISKTPASGLLRGATLRVAKRLGNECKRYGALPIPRAKGATIEQLCALVNQYLASQPRCEGVHGIEWTWQQRPHR